MKTRLITFGGFLIILLVFVKLYEKPLLAQIRAALVQSVDEPGRNPFVLTGGSSGGAWTVPAGKRYVVQQYTIYCNQRTTSPVTNALLSASIGGANYISTAQAHLGETISPLFTTYTATGTGPVYADAGTTIRLTPEITPTDASDAPTCSFYVTGYSISNP